MSQTFGSCCWEITLKFTEIDDIVYFERKKVVLLPLFFFEKVYDSNVLPGHMVLAYLCWITRYVESTQYRSFARIYPCFFNNMVWVCWGRRRGVDARSKGARGKRARGKVHGVKKCKGRLQEQRCVGKTRGAGRAGQMRRGQTRVGQMRAT